MLRECEVTTYYGHMPTDCATCWWYIRRVYTSSMHSDMNVVWTCNLGNWKIWNGTVLGGALKDGTANDFLGDGTQRGDSVGINWPFFSLHIRHKLFQGIQTWQIEEMGNVLPLRNIYSSVLDGFMSQSNQLPCLNQSRSAKHAREQGILFTGMCRVLV
jgi:hypothetical protein